MEFHNGGSFIDQSLKNKFITLGFKNYHDAFKLSDTDSLKLLDLDDQNKPIIKYATLIDHINDYGTLSPNGGLIATPKDIKLKLKIHQERTLYEMVQRENSKYRFVNGFNVNLLCDNVGSGKSMCILSLIANSPKATLTPNMYYSSKPFTSDPTHSYRFGSRYELDEGFGFHPTAIELNTNLIIVPHNVFNQWKGYIKDYTSIQTIFIAKKHDINTLCKTKETALEKLNGHNILLIKSTMFKYFHGKMEECFGKPYSYVDKLNENTSGVPQSGGLTFRSKFMRLNHDSKKISKLFFKACDEGDFELAKSVKDRLIVLQGEMKDLIDSPNWATVDIDFMNRHTKYIKIVDGYYFQRVIVDEVDSIRVPAFPYCYSKQIWYISSSINNLLYPFGRQIYDYAQEIYRDVSTGIKGTGFLREILVKMFNSRSHCNPRLDTYRGLFNIIRNSNKFIEYSIRIPEPIINYLECFTPAHLHAIKGAIDKEALKAFNAGDTAKAIEILGCKGGTEVEIIDQITDNLNKDKEQTIKKRDEKQIQLIEIQANLEAKRTELVVQNTLPLELVNIEVATTLQDEITILVKNRKNVKALIKSYKNKVETFESKIRGIKERISDVEHKSCPICYCDFSEPSITPCCQNIFCIECITMALSTSSKKECPLCRATIDIKNVNLIINDQIPKPEIDEHKLPTKLERLIKLVTDNPDKRYMIFSEYDASLDAIKGDLDDKDISFSGIKGSTSTIDNIINKFRDKEFKVLLLNARHFGAGLNLQFTDEIIIYHRMAPDLEKQVIGRAQRLGRTEPLVINYLCYDNEYS